MTFSISDAARSARQASRTIARMNGQQKDKLLNNIADNLDACYQDVIAANRKDLDAGQHNGLSDAMLDRLALDETRINAIADAVRAIAAQPDPVGTVSSLQPMASGIRVGKMRIPLGVIAMIYESRPNVTIDAAALCLKAGNAVILRGGKEALHSNLALATCIHDAMDNAGVNPAAVTVVPNPDRAVMNELMTLSDDIDLIIPRGGEGLIRFVTEHSRIPVIQHFKGVCHLYVDGMGDIAKGLRILENGKTQRTGVCNALETLLVDAKIADEFLPQASAMLASHHVKVHACDNSLKYFDNATRADEQDWHAEYLALEIAVRVVNGLDAAIEHIDKYGSGHTEVIVTQDVSRAQQFTQQIDSAVVMVNASSRFSDGGELGLGAEIGISTSKLHAYGPMGADSLTTEKFIVLGDGEIRQ
ncbi:glutamate-5-semialdehyde dehydrogenase [Aestuariibacter salexigens]|uniref:glutamate-5-semialdehyde dehydrogenase n=1 Tax=Aestuariibacter salexigens TaxID=226010 RepID=UPI0003F4E73F|nr:glutamate-5-semialdehyde dehydrogenase [Aestuariibacter salexigens]